MITRISKAVRQVLRFLGGTELAPGMADGIGAAGATGGAAGSTEAGGAASGTACTGTDPSGLPQCGQNPAPGTKVLLQNGQYLLEALAWSFMFPSEYTGLFEWMDEFNCKTKRNNNSYYSPCRVA